MRLNQEERPILCNNRLSCDNGLLYRGNRTFQFGKLHRKITVTANNDLEAIGQEIHGGRKILIYLCMYQRLNDTMQPTLASRHNDLYIRKRTV